MTDLAELDPWDEETAAAYFAFVAENYAGEVLLDKGSLEDCLTRQLYWTEFLADMAKRRA